MDHGLIDVTTAPFWLVVAIAAFLLAPVKQVNVRRLLLATVNLGFLWLVLELWLAPVLLALLVLNIALTLVATRHSRTILLVTTVGMAAALFVLHKLPRLSVALGTSSLNPLLATVGFSYIFLRLLDLLRAVWETNQAPDLIDLVNYLLPFHMLAAGPVQAYADFVAAPQLPAALTPRVVLEAIERIAQGLFKKFVLAYVLRQLFLSDFQ